MREKLRFCKSNEKTRIIAFKKEKMRFEKYRVDFQKKMVFREVGCEPLI